MIVREPGRDRWVVIDQAVIRNPRISHRARGILALLLSMPDDWTVNADWISLHGTEGRDAVRAALNELETVGHMIRHRSQDSKGHWTTKWVVYEQPVDRGVDNQPTEAGFPGVGFPGVIRSTEEEVLTKKNSDMTQERRYTLCTSCDATGWTTTPAGARNALIRCTHCDGAGTHGAHR